METISLRIPYSSYNTKDGIHILRYQGIIASEDIKKEIITGEKNIKEIDRHHNALMSFPECINKIFSIGFELFEINDTDNFSFYHFIRKKSNCTIE